MPRLPALLLLFSLALSAGPGAQSRPAIDPAHLSELTFRSIGPAITGGRVVDIAAVETRPSTFYAAAAIGGIWKTVNSGTTWLPVFEGVTSAAMGDVAIAPSNPDVVWVGTGESNADHGSWGDGVYKSIDAGRTWTPAGLRDSQHIGRIVIDPRDPNVVYVAAAGHLWGPNKERGLFKTADGGRTWSHVLAVDEHTGATDVMMDPSNPDMLIAATYQRQRSAWGFNGGGPGSGLHKSQDGGKTWKKLSAGLPAGPIGRIGFDVCRRKPNVLYARVEHAEGGVFRSDDRGETWRRVNTLNPQALGYGQIRVDPQDDQRVYLLGVQLYISDDGGATFRSDGASGVHSDHRGMWINPADPSHLIDGSDGGVYVSYDRARTWMFLANLPIAQFYHVGVDMRRPYYVYGGLQDYGSWGAPSRTRNIYGVLNDDWFMIAGADGFFTFVDPTDHRNVYTETQGGQLMRYDPSTGEHKSIRPESPDKTELRWNSNTPFLMSPHDPRTLYAGAQRVFRSIDGGSSWTPASGDLTTAANTDELALMGVTGRDISIGRNAIPASYGTLTALAESTKTRGLLYAGSDDGLLHVTRDGGKTWSNVTASVPGVPKQTWVSSLSTSYREANTAYVTFDGHRNDDFRPYVLMTTDAGATWTSIGGTLPTDVVTLIVREDPRSPNLLYLGTESGLFVSFDRGGHWTRLKNNLPVIPIDDLVVHPREHDLVLATRGRGIWILDDARPLGALAERTAALDAHLFEIRPGTQMHMHTNRVWMGHNVFAGPNPPSGTIINYHLATAIDGPVTLTIRSAAGETIRELTGPGTPGLHRLNWDLRLAPPAGVRGDPTGAFWSLGSVGPFALPGTYRVSLTVNGKEAGVRTVTVEGDPLVRITEVDRRRHMRALVAVTDVQSGILAASGALRTLVQQLGSLQVSLRGNTAVPEAVRSAGAALQRRIGEVLRGLGPPGEGGDGPPAPPAAAVQAVRAANAPLQGLAVPSAAPPAPDSGRGAGPRPPADAQAARLARPEAAEVRQMRQLLRFKVQMLKSELAGSQSAPTAAQQERLRAVLAEFAAAAGQFNALFAEAVPAFNRLLDESKLPRVTGVDITPLVPVKYTEPVPPRTPR